jgi:hypothetical protein
MIDTVEISGKIYRLCPFNAGQMRRHVDPTFSMTLELVKQMEKGLNDDNVSMLDIACKTREVQRSHADLVTMALQNSYPSFKLEDLDDMTPGEISDLFNAIMLLTQSGGKRGEAPAPKEVRSL